MKYKIGDKVFYVQSSTHYQKSIPCRICFGKRFVTIILGDGSEVKSMCGACDRGHESATGYETTWEPQAVLKSGTIFGVSCGDGIKYEVNGSRFREDELFQDEALAEKVRLIEFEEVTKRAEHWFKESFINCTKKQIWSANYHRRCIRDLERSISWHQMKIDLIKGSPQRTDKGE